MALTAGGLLAPTIAHAGSETVKYGNARTQNYSQKYGETNVQHHHYTNGSLELSKGVSMKSESSIIIPSLAMPREAGEHVPTSSARRGSLTRAAIFRRKPLCATLFALALLSACGGGGGDDENLAYPSGMGPDTETRKSALAATAATKDQILSFINISYLPTALKAAHFAVANVYEAARQAGEHNGPYYAASDFSGGNDNYGNDLKYAWSKLNQSRKDAALFLTRKVLNGQIIVGNISLPYTPASLEHHRQSVKSLTDQQIQNMKQYYSEEHHLVSHFLLTGQFTTGDIYQWWVDKSAALETTHDARYLVTAADTEDDHVLNTRTGVYTVVMGSKHKPVEQYELVADRPHMQWWYWIVGRPKADWHSTATYTKHGKNSTTIESQLVNTADYNVTDRDDYKLTSEQTDGLNAYADDWVNLRGSIANYSKDETKRKLVAISTALAKKTGLVYESFLAGSYALRIIGQIEIAAVRAMLATKTIDLVAANKAYTDWLATQTAIAALPAISRNGLIGFGSALIATGAAAGLYNGVMVKSVYEVVNDPANAGLTNEKLAEKAWAKQRAAMGTASAVTSMFASANLVYTGTFGGEAALARIWSVPAAFAVADITGGITEMVVVIKSGQYTSNAGILTLAAAGARLLNAGVSIYDVLAKTHLLDVYRKKPLPLLQINPLGLTSVGAGVSAAFYILGYTFTYL